jgi:benzoyl-CoA 2,3-dioxygenase component A
MGIPVGAVIKQHLIDPQICIRCNTCESIRPSGAITHDASNYVIDATKCKLCMACIEPCPTGAIDGWRTRPRSKAYSIQEQLGWDALPDALTAAELTAEGIGGAEPAVTPVAPLPAATVAVGAAIKRGGRLHLETY